MNGNYKDMKKALKYPFRKPCEKPICTAISAIFAEKSTMKITFTYKRRSYNYEAEIVTLEQNRQTIKACYPIGIKSEWIVLFWKKHSPLFYMDDGTPVLARYKTASGKDSFFQVFIDTETKQIVESLSIRARTGLYRQYTLQEVLFVRRAEKVMLVKS